MINELKSQTSESPNSALITVRTVSVVCMALFAACSSACVPG